MKITIILLVLLFCLMNPFSLNATDDGVSLAFVGDILLAGKAGRMMEKYGTGYSFQKVAPILKEADLAFGNLECALTGKVITRNVKIQGKKWFSFKVPPQYAQALVEGGIDIVSLANNHSLDGGREGLRETIKTLEDLKIVYVGAGRNYEESRLLKVVEVKNRCFGFLAYNDIGPIMATKTQAGVASAKDLQEVKKDKEKVDVLIVSFHWGIEGTTKPSAHQRRIAQAVIDAGADVIIGHHPHVLQPVEIYKGKTIAYSLGNFVFDNPRPLCCETMILIINFSATGEQRIKEVPCYIKNAQPYPISKSQD